MEICCAISSRTDRRRAESRRTSACDALLAQANEAAAGMAGAFLADLISGADKAMFKAYAACKLALNKIDQQPGYPATVDWPIAPAN
ncbi:hypothetical protein C1X69_02550 [Pseudomonas sp. FW305-67]|nr:hypothetical protein C1X70_27480 [Pseudomonas sp. FW305-53]PMY83576.1 hypothetical protein C1X68_28995 [Pseudomonas sp. FW303-C2]PMY90641.1 hypothetical protein C1X67_22425 [Pseudomonas sp. FW305-62]PNA43740.1 hypothetical protein C1X71_11660 [Pseudomonas sp. FW306-2-2C-A10BC]PNA81233.1 hypothetical protein C1X66_28745 [Pseudomonas sp. MPR-R3B]PNB23734.1 hypothetical protein C1X69_02550 [Pseudomonas sp. FW305-67]